MSTKEIAEFIERTKYDQIPKEAIRVAKRCFMDTTGVALAASKQPEGEIITKFTKERKAAPEASVIGGGFKTSVDLAALANGTLSHALDYDDISVEFLGHPSTVIVPAVLALSESRRVSGKDALCSFILGFEVGAMIGKGMGVKFFESSWHPTPVVGIMGATAASAKILGLNAQQLRMAFGIASSLAGGLTENFGTMTKPLHAGSAVKNSLLSVLLAKEGFTASEDILEGERGLYKAFIGEAYSPEGVKDLGKRWSILTPGVKIKRYPCCGGTFGCIEAILELKKKYNLLAEEVAEIHCRVNPSVLETLIVDVPKTAKEGRFSLKYTIAIALLDGEVLLKQFSEEKVSSPITHDLMRKVKAVPFPDFGRGQDMPQEVIVKLKDGGEYSYKVEKVKGTASNPLSDAELESKFRDCASLALNTKRIDKTLELLHHLENLEDMTELMEIVVDAYPK